MNMATTTGTSNEKHQQTIADYVGDMAALEAHIEEALDRQLTQLQDEPAALSTVKGFHDTVKEHRDTLRALQEETGATAGNPIKDMGAALLGKAAGVIDLVRTEGNSKALRDDYAAFSLAAISYSMLYTTAHGLGNQKVAALAERFLKDHAEAIMQINQLMPEVVARELAKDGHQVRDGAVMATRKIVDRSWETR
jgi:ferritin-like metal-binding protein YciE